MKDLKEVISKDVDRILRLNNEVLILLNNTYGEHDINKDVAARLVWLADNSHYTQKNR